MATKIADLAVHIWCVSIGVTGVHVITSPSPLVSGLWIFSLTPLRRGPQLPVLQRWREIKLSVCGPVLSLIPVQGIETAIDNLGFRVSHTMCHVLFLHE